MALPILRKCRDGEYLRSAPKPRLPTLREALTEYAEAKKVKASSLTRYESLLRTHFSDWFDRPVSALRDSTFADHCHRFAQLKGAALVDLGRGIVGSILKFLGAVHGVEIASPFVKLSAAGLLPERPQPRARKLSEDRMSAWFAAVAALPEMQRDYLNLLLLTGLRKNECSEVRRKDVDLVAGLLLIPETKGKNPHSLPITEPMRQILERRCQTLEPSARLFAGLSADHVTEMAERAGAPKFTLHDLRKLVASVGARLNVGDAILRRILGHAPKFGDTLHKHYVRLGPSDVLEPLKEIQLSLQRHQTRQRES
nr:site-specific integrase [Caballeronia novacaledonica]